MRPELEDTQAAPTTPGGEDRTATGVPSEPRPIGSGAGLAPGRQLGHFRIDRQLGAGGMGEVYLATDLALDRPVAVKVLPEALARDARRRERMIREARAQARITHPNVGHMYFIGEDTAGDGRLFFAMEYVQGETLAERVTKGPMAVDDALAVIRDAALGLREAQRSGYTHRDVKPSNLMIDGHGMVKVLDFGLAAGDFENTLAGSAGPVAQTSLAGTPLYMAPEQARGDAVDFRSDIYALGATLFHLIAGKPPFESDSVEGLLSAHATAARPGLPRRGQPRVQIGAIDQLCTKMMAPRAEDRFGSYDELLRAIELASTTHTRPAGFWARCMATLVDFTMVAIVIALIEAIVKFQNEDNDINIPLLIPFIVIFQTLTTARWGSTAGKALMELEVVDVATGARPRWSQAIVRSLSLYGPVLLSELAQWFGRVIDVQIVVDIAHVVGFVGMGYGFFFLLHAALRIPGKRAWWDRRSRTMVRYRTGRTSLLRPAR